MEIEFKTKASDNGVNFEGTPYGVEIIAWDNGEGADYYLSVDEATTLYKWLREYFNQQGL